MLSGRPGPSARAARPVPARQATTQAIDAIRFARIFRIPTARKAARGPRTASRCGARVAPRNPPAPAPGRLRNGDEVPEIELLARDLELERDARDVGGGAAAVARTEASRLQPPAVGGFLQPRRAEEAAVQRPEE